MKEAMMINPFETDYGYIIILITAMFMYFSILHILRDPNLPKKKFFKSKDTK
jgi:hypothetical protein